MQARTGHSGAVLRVRYRVCPFVARTSGKAAADLSFPVCEDSRSREGFFLACLRLNNLKCCECADMF